MNWSAMNIETVFRGIRSGAIRVGVGANDGSRPVRIVPPALITDAIQQAWLKMLGPKATPEEVDPVVLSMMAAEALDQGEKDLAVLMLLPGATLMLRPEDIVPLLLAQQERPGGTVH